MFPFVFGGGEKQSLAKELVMSRNAKNRMYEAKAQLHSVQMQLQQQLGENGTSTQVSIGRKRGLQGSMFR